MFSVALVKYGGHIYRSPQSLRPCLSWLPTSGMTQVANGFDVKGLPSPMC